MNRSSHREEFVPSTIKGKNNNKKKKIKDNNWRKAALGKQFAFVDNFSLKTHNAPATTNEIQWSWYS